MTKQTTFSKLCLPLAILVALFSVSCSEVPSVGGSYPRPWADEQQPSQEHGGAWIGAALQDLPPEASQSLGEDRNGALITQLFKDEPAEKAGLRSGDIILEINRVRKRTAADVVEGIYGLVPNVSAVFTVDRDGRRLFITVVPREAATRAEILDAQRNLSKLGYNPGPVDGKARGSTQRAIRAFQAAKGLPQDGRLTPFVRQLLNHNAGLRAVERGDLDGAIALFTKLIASPTASPRQLARAYYNRGVTQANLGRFEQATVDWRKAQELVPSYELPREASEKLANSYYERANEHANAGHMDEAIANWELTLTLDPDHAMARRNLDRAYEASGRRPAPSAAPRTGEPEDMAPLERPDPGPSPSAEEPLDELLDLDE